MNPDTSKRARPVKETKKGARPDAKRDVQSSSYKLNATEHKIIKMILSIQNQSW